MKPEGGKRRPQPSPSTRREGGENGWVWLGLFFFLFILSSKAGNLFPRRSGKQMIFFLPLLQVFFFSSVSSCQRDKEEREREQTHAMDRQFFFSGANYGYYYFFPLPPFSHLILSLPLNFQVLLNSISLMIWWIYSLQPVFTFPPCTAVLLSTRNVVGSS